MGLLSAKLTVCELRAAYFYGPFSMANERLQDLRGPGFMDPFDVELPPSTRSKYETGKLQLGHYRKDPG
jgi:hypothetical protein